MAETGHRDPACRVSNAVESCRAGYPEAVAPCAAIPDHELSAGRVLQLDSLDAAPVHTIEFGRRVALRLRVVETGKLTGQFNLLVDLEIAAARALAQTLLDAVDQASRIPPVSLRDK